MDISLKICEKLNLNPKLQLKKDIRGLIGYTVSDLIDAIITTDNLDEAANLLGYTTNPIKQSIRQVLLPLFTSRSKAFVNGGGLVPWRVVLLEILSLKRCTKCKVIQSKKNFHSNISKHDNLSSNCKPCAITDAKISKIYIVQRTPLWASLENIYEIYKNCPCGYHVDHIIPLKGKLVSGLHVETNLQYLLAQENKIKSNNYIIE